MKKLCLIVIALLVIMGIPSLNVSAAEQEKISISIVSPQSISGYPGLDETITAEIHNNTDNDIDDVMVYITMADWGNHMTVNLEDYFAEKPVNIDTLGAGETKTVELPLRFMYVSEYTLYTTVVSSGYNQIASSLAIPVIISGNTMIDKGMVQTIAVVTPVVILLLVIGVHLYRQRAVA